MKRSFQPRTWISSIVLMSVSVGCSAVSDPDPQDSITGESTQALVTRPGARLILSDATLSRLKARASAGDAAWTALKQKCDGYATGTMYAPNGDAYPDFPNVGQGYQGEEYVPAIRALGLCYRTTSDTVAQARYGAAGAKLLDAMSTPQSAGGQSPATDSGYGIRNYVVGMAFGFDWLYPALSSTTKSRVVTSINSWIDWYDQSGFIKDDPIGNYFSGYFLAKTTAALATDGDNPKATEYWNDVVTRMWGTLVKPAFTSKMAGGGWPEGWGYGKKAVLSMAEALWATKTATGLDWWKDLPLAHDEAAYAMQFSWPSLKHVDDQGTIRAGTNIRPSTELFTGLATMLEAMGDTTAGTARSFAADVKATAGDDRAPWAQFLYGDPAATSSAYTSAPLSHFAAGPAHVAMRSGWEKSAVWGAFSGGPYINAADSGEQLFGAGGLSVVVGDQPLLINPTGWLPQNAGTAGEDMVYDDGYGKKQRRLYNTFFVDDTSNTYNPGQNSAGPSSSKAHVERYDAQASYVHARGVGLGDQYGTGGKHPVTQFTRDLVYLRPGTFVLFDRTTVAQGSADQWLSFHTPVAPSSVSTTDASQRRFDVKVGTNVVGSIRSLLPKNASTTSTSLPASASRLEVHAPVRAAAQQWLTVVSAGASIGEQVRLSAADGNVAAGNLVGVELQGQVVLFSADQAATASVTSADYTVSAASANHVLVDVEPSSSGYSVTATPSGGKLRIRVSAGGSFMASTAKALAFSVTADGTVTASAPAAAPTTPTTPATPTDTTVPSSGTSQTVTLTQGVNGYAGVTDASIASLNYSSSANPTGTVYKTNDMLYTYGLDYTAKALIRFDVSQIPATASVVSAKLDMTIESWVSPQVLIGNFLKTPWSYSSSTFGWSSGGSGSAWTAPGIGAGDVQGPAFSFSNIDASGYQRRSVTLDAATVQTWVRSASANQGIVLANRDAGKVLRIFSSEASDAAKRPSLTVTYR